MFEKLRPLVSLPVLSMALLAAANAALAAPAPSAAAARQQKSPELEQRLEHLIDELEAQRIAQHIPGLAIAVVKDGEVIFADGLGQADIENDRPVTPETLFAAGSTTKAFTSALVAMMVDEGRMEWDAPIEEYLPYFKLPVRSADAPEPAAAAADGAAEDDAAAEPTPSHPADQATLRDLLSHRTGFTRMSLLWVSGEASAEEILRAAVTAEPWTTFRTSFHYNNVMYLAAGAALASVSGQAWEELVAERIFEPLDMHDSSVSITSMLADPRHATGYTWDDVLNAHEAVPMRELDAIAPAGAINSNVLDLAKWVAFLLDEGSMGGEQLISEAALAETMTPQISISPDVAYGMGWFIRDWQGHRVVEHGGNIDGFAAQVSLLPEENLGYVLLMNKSVAPLQQGSIAIVFDALLGELDDEANALATDEDLARYLGRYVADFPPFGGQSFEVKSAGGRLAVDVPGQMLFELGPPDDSGLRSFAVAPEIQIEFVEEDGRIVALKLHQAGMTFELPREGVERAAEVTPAEVEEYLGTYHSPDMGHDVTVLIRNGRLAVDVPNQMVFELAKSEDQDRWNFRAVPDIAIEFNRDDAGAVQSLTLFQAGQEFLMPKTAGAADLGADGDGASDLPTTEEILALRDAHRLGRIDDLGLIEMLGTGRVANAGITGDVRYLAQGTDRYRTEVDFGRFGRIITAVNPEGGWSDASFSPFETLRGKYLAQAQAGHPAFIFGDWRTLIDSIEVLDREVWNEAQTIVLRLKQDELPPMKVWIDAATGDVLRMQSTTLLPEIGSLPNDTTFSDYRQIHGLRIPFRMESRNEFEGRSIITFDEVLIHRDYPQDIFTLEPPDETGASDSAE